MNHKGTASVTLRLSLRSRGPNRNPNNRIVPILKRIIRFDCIKLWTIALEAAMARCLGNTLLRLNAMLIPAFQRGLPCTRAIAINGFTS